MRKRTRTRPDRKDLVDAAVLEVHGLVHDQGWLADRALEGALRRERHLWSSERRAVAEAVYGIVRWQGQLDLLLGGAPSCTPTPRRCPTPRAGCGPSAPCSIKPSPRIGATLCWPAFATGAASGWNTSPNWRP